MLKRFILPLALSLTIAQAALAGSLVDGIYSSNLGYQITPPSGWIKFDASTVNALQRQAPHNLKNVNFSRVDVVFYPPFDTQDTSLQADIKRTDALKAAQAPPPAPQPPDPPPFSPSISVMVLRHAPTSNTTDVAKAYAEAMKKEVKGLADYASSFKISKSTFDTVNGQDVFQFIIEYTTKGRGIRVEQTLFMQNATSIVVTCTSDTNEYMQPQDWCSRTVASLRQ
ncbi:MAG: hypothetical protein FWC40_01000 [Proteobacteria bacterium]|nr:hypothetical protein [Pseudomonadota bacterium]